MNKIVIFLVLFLPISEIRSQNLVPNPDFEDTLACPLGPACIYCASNWNSCLGSPDYFNMCAPSCLPPQTCSGIPNNWAGTQNAFSGNAYAGLFTAGYGGLSREVQIVQLIEPLDIGKKYYLSCYISRAYISSNHGASNNFGFRFSTVEFDPFNEVSIDNFSHYHDTTIITDTLNWTRIEGSFFADSSYRFLMLGNFYDDNNTDTLDMQPTTAPWNYAYYYIDQVCVTPDSGNCTPINGLGDINSQDIKVYPNPFGDLITVQTSSTEELELIIYDVLGKCELKKNFRQNILVGDELQHGLYFYIIRKENLNLKSGKVLKD